ncbi:MAG: M15 family metallopeptidase [Lachnospiraceae bacterium]|nr:M15 family metallopeptidase [Lachnospiraceae bacterium]
MYLTKQEKVKQRLKGFAHKNLICRLIVAPVRGLFEVIFMISNTFGNNIKKIGVAFISILLFPVFSSFSFGLDSETETPEWSIDFEALDDSVFIAEKSETAVDELAQIAEENTDEEEHKLEVAVSESGEISKEDLYQADDIISDYLENTSSEDDEVSEDNSRDYTETYEDYKFDPDDWRLMLINKSHFIPDDYEVPLGTIYGVHQCDKRIIPDLIAMLKAAKDDGVNLSIRSPYRTSALQVLLYNNKITKFMDVGMSYLEAYKLAGQAVTIPGASEHEAGLSLDIVSDTYTSLTEGFGETEAGKWLAANAHYYGFILRYPAEKEYITTIEYEPWHFRYVGVEAATVMYNENLTLEEFWEIYLEQ